MATIIDPPHAPGHEPDPGVPPAADEVCYACGGTGKLPDGSMCGTCGGSGRVASAAGGG